MKNKAFTMIEVLISMMLLTTAIVALSSAWSSSIVAFRKTRNMDIVTNLLQQKLTEKEMEYKENFPTDELEEAGDFGSDFENMSWKVEVKDKEFPDLSPLLINQNEGANEMSLMVINRMTTYMSEAVKEMKVTILFNSNGQVKDYSVTTYLVDYTKQVSIP